MVKTDYFTHKQIIESAKQYFVYKNCAMSRTIHHNRCIDYYFKALMNCEEIFDVTLMDILNVLKKHSFMNMLQTMQSRQFVNMK